MDYCQWGKQYLREAEAIARHTAPLQGMLKQTAGKERLLLLRRISMLESMHFECMHTGRMMLERGGRLAPRS